MNHVSLIGRLTRDPEVRYSGDQMAIARFSIAIDRPPRRDGTKETDFPNIVVFGKQAENCEKYLVKGRLVAIEGRIQTGSYTNRNGDKVYTTEVVANRVEFLEWGDRQARQPQAQQSGWQQPQTQPQNNWQQPQAQPQNQNGWQQPETGWQQPSAPQQSSGLPQGFESIDDDDLPF